MSTLMTANNDNIIEPVSVSLQVVGRKKNADGVFERTYEAREDGKSSTITSVEGRRMVAEPIHIPEYGANMIQELTTYL
jgi:hypothetical protein